MKAVIFDMDGVLLDTQKYHAIVEAELLRELGLIVEPAELTRRFAGVPLEEKFSTLAHEHGFSVNLNKLRQEKDRRYVELLRKEIVPIPGAIELVDWLKLRHVRVGLATTTDSRVFGVIDEKMHFWDLFDAVVTGDEVEHGKPSPDIFLEAARRLGVPPEDCVVVEDGQNGVKAARKAGMLAIGFGPHAAGDFQVHSMDEVRAILAKLFNF